MYYIFYHPKTLQIKGYSTEKTSMSFPYAEVDIEPVLLWNWKIEDGKAMPIRAQFTKEEWELIDKNGKL